MYSLRNLVIAIAAAIGVGACSSAGSGPSVGPTPAEESTTVEVRNYNWSDMVVYAVHGGMRHRLGMVTSMTTQELTLPRWLVQPGREVRLATDPIGSTATFTTEPILVAPGQRIEFTVQNHLSISSYAVWNH
jgi:hypothetical protein